MKANLAIVVVLFMLLAMPHAGAPFFTLQSEDSTVIPRKYEERLVELDRLALEEAYQRQIRNLFAGWMKDSHGQPERARRGAMQARKAFVAVMTDIDKRVEQLKKDQ